MTTDIGLGFGGRLRLGYVGVGSRLLVVCLST